ncbi:MAG: ComEC/Rec2 family competence protein [Butyrivibrio sp.]|nr:ComEC/Rec2 family competence protein [Butyrivibrio sp.]
MKRPLCLMALILTAAVFIYLELFLDDITGKTPADMDGRYITVVGKVQEKEFRKSFEGEILPVIYLIPNDQDISDLNLIQCYLESSDFLPAIGEYAEVSGKVKVFSSPTNPGEFDSRLYYSSLKISYRITKCKVLRTGGKKNSYREFLFEIRMFLERALDLCFSEEDASIMKAMLLGDKAYMDSEIKELYQGSGIIHILAVSGLHISIIGMGIYKLLNLMGLGLAEVFSSIHYRCWYILSALLAIGFMYSYGIMCGMGTSSFRAICMFVIRLMAPLVGRTYDILSALALAEILLLLDQPLYLYNSGFLFSFGAVLGITVVRPVLAPAVVLGGEVEEKMKFVDEGERGILSKSVFGLLDISGKGKALYEGIMSSLGILLVTLPVYACFYYTYPVHSLVLNLVVIPVMGALMTLGIICLALGSLALFLINELFLFGQGFSGMVSHGSIFIMKIPAALVHMILGFYKWLCSGSAIRSGFTWYMGHSEKWQVVAYVALVAIFVITSWMIKEGKFKLPSEFGGSNRKPVSGKDKEIPANGKEKEMSAPGIRHRSHIFDLLRGMIVVIAVFVLTFRISPDLEIDMIDVGQGDGIVISCEGKNMLIDGGSTSKNNVGKYQIIPFLKYKGIGTLDAVVMTHEDKDHISGILEIMDDMEKGGISIAQLILPEVSEVSRGDSYRGIEERARRLGIPISYINTGESFNLGKAQFTCLNPQLNMVTEGANAYSTVLFMEYKGAGKAGGNSGGRFTALFTGDMEEEGLENVNRVLRENNVLSGRLTLLKVAHHGSKYTTDEEFLSLTNPSIAVISCGRDNSYGHPHTELLERLEKFKTSVYRTDQGGEISVIVRNSKVSVNCFGSSN